MNKKERSKIENLTRDDIEHIMRTLCIASVRHDEAQARMNEDLARVKKRYEPDMATWRAEYDNAFSALEVWARAHEDQFAPTRSIALLHGILGFRLGKPMLKPKRGMTWEKVLDLLKRLNPSCVRTTEEVDKQALMGLGDENLETLGVVVTQADRFYVEPAKEVIELEVAK